MVNEWDVWEYCGKSIKRVERNRIKMAVKSLVGNKGNEVKKSVNSKEVKGKMDLESAGKVLELSIYRVRQIYWEGKLGEGKKVGKKIYVDKGLVEKLVMERSKEEEESNGLEERRLGKRVVKSCEVIEKVLDVDKEVKDDLRKALKELLVKWSKEGESLIEENKVEVK